jgi:diguanylate cyclase (GGDEF)-like protein
MNPFGFLHRQPLLAVYGVVGTGFVLLAAGFVAFGMLPMGVRLNAQIEREIEHFLHTSVLQLGIVLESHFDIANQMASRTAIRHKLLAYERGEVGLEELVRFSRPKLADGLLASESAHGVSRFDARGEKLIELGEAVDSAYYLSAPGELSAITARGPVTIAGVTRLLYYTPLKEVGYGIIGYDLIVMDDALVREIVDTGFGEAGTMFLVQDGKTLYRGAGESPRPRAAALSAFLAGRALDDRYRIDWQRVEPAGWDLYLIVDMQVFRAPLVRDVLFLSLFVAAAAAGVLLLTILSLRPALRAVTSHERLVHLAYTDGLTGLANHNHFLDRLEEELSRVVRHGKVLSLLFLDLDHFKLINDDHGHQCGDMVLEAVASILRSSIRRSDVPGRYGGEEFAVMLPETGADSAFVLAERIRQRVADREFDLNGRIVQITISAGVATYPGRGEMSARDLIDAADASLYAAKHAGRNRVWKAA